MIRNIIFDIGNVLTDYRWEGFLADKGFDAEMIKKIAKASIMHPLWAEYDRGTWTDEQVLSAFVKDAPELEKELHQAFENIAGMVTPRAYAIPWLQELKAKGYHVYYLSNFSHKAETECAEALNFLPEYLLVWYASLGQCEGGRRTGYPRHPLLDQRAGGRGTA